MALRGWGQLYIQSTPPAEAPVVIGSLWFDTSTGLLKKCTAINPSYVYVSIEGGGGGIFPSDSVSSLDGTDSAGTALTYSRGDHKHGDVNRPSSEEKDALEGTDGTPSSINKYVTNSDSRLENLGDVIGPASSIDNAIVRFDGDTGVYIQDSNVTVEDNGDIIGKSFVTTRSGTVNRIDGLITSVVLSGGRTISITRIGGYVSSVTDGTRTWTITRDGDNIITGWTVS